MPRPRRAPPTSGPLLLALGAAALLLAAAPVPPRPPARVTDLAGLLSADQRRALEGRLAAFEQETTHQVAILIVPSLEGEPIEDLAQRTYSAWKLGRAGVDNGVLLVIALRDRRTRIHTGYGLEPSLPDGLAGAILREALAPRFRAGDYAGGLQAALDRIFAVTRGADLSAVPVRRAREARRAWGTTLALYGLLALAAFGLAHFAARRFLGRGFWTLAALSGAGMAGGAWLQAVPWGFLPGLAGVALGLAVIQHFVEEAYRCPRCGGWLRRTVARGAALAAPGGDVVTSTCLRCRYQSRTVRRAAAWAAGDSGYWLGGSGGGWSGGGGDWGGFSGGGGESGGGGASGDW